MTDRSRSEAEPVLFGERLANSQAFSGLFREGMALVEETAAYLDGDQMASDPKAVAVLAAWGLAGYAVAARRFGWAPRER